ncbi:MAG TPA: DUF5685 family protein [Clostridiales bacterium]|nr:DUF5685 family protein [Clostridiales bacterium]HPV00947.1 DUF5685 family protein [Clostridiales bacterium]
MFGYVVPEKPEMKIKEYELFRAYYCGVCRSIGRRCGQLKRLTLSYDTTFLAVLLSAAAGEKVQALRKRCPLHPFERRHVISGSSAVDYASDINIILAYYNLEDKKRDRDSAVSAAALAMLKRSFGRLRKKYPDKCCLMEQRLGELIRLEKQKCGSMDMAAEPFARMMEEITAYEPLCTGEETRKVLRWLGYNLGKWIYLLDAFDDIEKDIKSGNYNPFVYQFGYNGQDVEEFRGQIREKAAFTLFYTLNEISRAFELLDVKLNRGILENIIYIGMLRKTENILGIRRCGEVEESV